MSPGAVVATHWTQLPGVSGQDDENWCAEAPQNPKPVPLCRGQELALVDDPSAELGQVRRRLSTSLQGVVRSVESVHGHVLEGSTVGIRQYSSRRDKEYVFRGTRMVSRSGLISGSDAIQQTSWSTLDFPVTASPRMRIAVFVSESRMAPYALQMRSTAPCCQHSIRPCALR